MLGASVSATTDDVQLPPGTGSLALDASAHAGGSDPDGPSPSLPRLLPRWAPLVLLAPLMVLALVETLGALTASWRVATAAEWDAAASDVRAGFRAGDLVVFAPSWSDPVGRLHLGDLVSPEMAARADASHYGRAWEVSIRGARAAETQAPGARLVSESRHGRVRVALYQLPAPTLSRYDFCGHFADAEAFTFTARAPESARACTRDAGGFLCGPSSGPYGSGRIEPRILEVDYLPRRGLLVPPQSGKVTRLVYKGVTLGAALVGYTALHDYYSRKSADGPVEFSVFIDGAPVYEVMHGNGDGWRRFAVDTTKYSPGLHEVRFEIESASPAWRTFGFFAETVAPPDAPAAAGTP